MKAFSRMGVAVLAVLALAFAGWACGDGEQPRPAEKTPAAGGVPVDLDEWSVTVEETLQAGSVTFEVDNHGAQPHELVIIKTDLAADALPVAGAKVDEDGTGLALIGEVEEFPAGQTEEGTFQLEAGRYVFICNIAGHYEQGMFAEVTVE